MKNIKIFYDIGKRERQEDRYLFFTFRDMNFILLMDGHGYQHNKIELVQLLYHKFNNLIQYFFKTRDVNKNNLYTFFKQLDESIYKKKINSGVCLTLMIQTKDLIYICTIGDVGCLILNSNFKILYKNQRHTFYNKYEIERYKQFGLEIFIKNNRYRGLKVSRSLGNTDIRAALVHPMVGIPNIDVFDFIIESKIILFTDGMLEHFMECDLAANDDIFSVIITQTYKDNATLIFFTI